ncbi:hypothetical protein POM88_021178 [Heracleum sosnowskyi]|uniref:Transposase-associated domain-containing protein n=1 Tax=Heracleum sosnowskyi TaxID=360622 RepID=A0AAD8IFE3_9APIA|nr:hypothetical protein POM88_021178 [Heracleum sosnowskyi]
MTSDRSWVGRYRYDESKYLTEEYKNGVDSFLKFSIDHLKNEDEGLIRCPCQKCGNEYYKDPSDVRLDLYLHGIMQWYTRWDLHGEKEPQFETGTSSGNVGYNDDNMYDDMESEKEGPVSNYDFMNTVYHFEKPADLKLKEDMERMMATESTPEDSAPTDPPLSPRSQKKLQLKKDFSLTLQVRPPRKGKTILFPRHTVSEFVLRVSADMNRLVHSLEMEEVPRSLLNERMHLLANEAFPNRDHDPEQQQSWFEYLRLAVSFVADAMVLYKKVILEVIVDAIYSTPYVGS